MSSVDLSSEQQALALQKALDIGLQHHAKGDLSKAKNISVFDEGTPQIVGTIRGDTIDEFNNDWEDSCSDMGLISYIK